jgi:hypothetical protein
MVQRDLQGRFCEQVAAHVLSSSPDKIRLILITELTVLWIMDLELEIIHALMVEELNLLATVQVRDDSALAIDIYLIVVFDQFTDTLNGYLHLHVIKRDANTLAIDGSLNSDFAQLVEKTTACCLSDFLLISFGWCLDMMVGEFLIGVNGMHDTATVDHTQDLIGLESDCLQLLGDFGNAFAALGESDNNV